MRTRLVALEIAGFESVLMMAACGPVPFWVRLRYPVPVVHNPGGRGNSMTTDPSLVRGYTAGATTSELGDQFGIG